MFLLWYCTHYGLTQWTVSDNKYKYVFILQKLEFAVGEAEPRSPDAKALSIEQITTNLEELIIRRRAENETVFDWIEGNVGEPRSKEASFIRALMTVVCRSAIDGESRDI